MADQPNEDESIAVDEKGDEIPNEPAEEPVSSDGPSRWSGFKNWYKSHKKLSIPLSLAAFLLVLMILPWTRYPVAGLVYKKDYRFAVIDSVTKAPVSGATVSAAGVTADTNGEGVATLHLSVGKHSFKVSKNFYTEANTTATVPILSQKDVASLTLQATGRQVKITVTNLFNHQPLANALIKFTDGQAQTDSTGTALAVVPEATKEAKATISLSGYSDNQVSILADDSTIKENAVMLTPAGKLYFLSKLSGQIDVVKTDLDGKHRNKVLPGTGKEEESNTILLASRDWKFLALLSRRDGGTPKLYLIDTSTDKLTTIDDSAATITPIGWDDHYFVYESELKSHKPWQAGGSSIKSFNADTQRGILLDNAKADGSNYNHYTRERYDYFYAGRNNFYLINHNLVYSKSWDWNSDDATADVLLAGKKNTIQQINVTGSGHFNLLSYDVDKFLESFLYDPQTIYYHLDGEDTAYYKYVNGSVDQNAELKEIWDDKYAADSNHTFLLSPSGKQVFWYDELDGKNTLRVGDDTGQNPKLAGRSADLVPYGWYTDDYLLLSKNQSELYIIPSSASDSVKAFHITDYHKPARSFYGYGGGYGGL